VVIADDDLIDAADLLGLGVHTEATGGTDQRQRRRRSRGGDLQRSRPAGSLSDPWAKNAPRHAAAASQLTPETTAGGSPRTGRPARSTRPVQRASTPPSRSTHTRYRGPACTPPAGSTRTRAGWPYSSPISRRSRRAIGPLSSSASTTTRPAAARPARGQPAQLVLHGGGHRSHRTTTPHLCQPDSTGPRLALHPPAAFEQRPTGQALVCQPAMSRTPVRSGLGCGRRRTLPRACEHASGKVTWGEWSPARLPPCRLPCQSAAEGKSCIRCHTHCLTRHNPNYRRRCLCWSGEWIGAAGVTRTWRVHVQHRCFAGRRLAEVRPDRSGRRTDIVGGGPPRSQQALPLRRATGPRRSRAVRIRLRPREPAAA